MKKTLYTTQADPLYPDHLSIINVTTGETVESCSDWIDALLVIAEILNNHIKDSDDSEDGSMYKHFEDLLEEVFVFFTSKRPFFSEDSQEIDRYERYEMLMLAVDLHEDISEKLHHYSIWFSVQKEAPFWISDEKNEVFVVFCNKDMSFSISNEQEVRSLAAKFGWPEKKTTELSKDFTEWHSQKNAKLN